jgi:hypothetical protein
MSMTRSPHLRPEANPMPVCPIKEIALIEATTESLDGYATLIPDPDECDIEIVQWPRPGWRPVEPGTGDEGGTTEGIFACAWEGHTLRAVNDAVSGDYIVGWSCEPSAAESTKGDLSARDQVYIWHANYHPDGGQLFFPLDNGPFVAPLALPGDDVTPDDFVAFWFDGSHGLYIHPGIWHEGVFPLNQRQRFFDKQGKVHARINVDFVKEFNCYVSFPVTLPELT